MVTGFCAILVAVITQCSQTANSKAASSAGSKIKIDRATYRADVSHSCLATGKVDELCNDKLTCSVLADNNLCGDPMFETSKTLIVEYSCGDIGKLEQAAEGQKVYLRCK
ncbi:hypothetical protein HZ993_19270 [Rhodoferax sp. AJA081-3]|nr:hypothetical protein HZ993_19270 [Rhodoferax sp. AJA081-3]